MAWTDFRAFLQAAREADLLRLVEAPVDPAWEPACLAKWVFHGLPMEQRFGLEFPRVQGADFPLVIGALGASYASYALALGVERPAINARWLQALDVPVPPRQVAAGACQEECRLAGEARLGALPVPVWTPGKDPGPYLTTITLTRHADTGIHNLGVYRARVLDDRRVVVNLAPGRQGRACADTWLSRGRPAPIAWVVGAEPAVHLAAVANLEPGVDEITVAGGLKGGPVELVRARTVDLLVPARAEMIIEGEVLPGEQAPEGPFGESAGYMSGVESRPVARITAITHRRDATYYGLSSQMPPSESTVLQSLGNAGLILHRLRRRHGATGVQDVHIDLMFGGGGAHGIVALAGATPAEARRLGRILAHETPLKRITLVDADVDVRNPAELDWVMAAHYDPARDTEIVGGFPAAMDHAVTPGPDGRKLGSKLIVDATRGRAMGPNSLPGRRPMAQALDTWRASGLPDPPLADRLRQRLEGD